MAAKKRKKNKPSPSGSRRQGKSFGAALGKGVKSTMPASSMTDLANRFSPKKKKKK